jgi:DNA-binding Xre family transcriptional regulator
MLSTHFKLAPLLRQHKKTPLALAEASGLSKNTVYNIVNNKAKAIELETLDKLIIGLEKLIGRSVGFSDIFEKSQSSTQQRLEQLLRDAKPFHWQEVTKDFLPLAPEDEAEGEAFIQALQEQSEQDRQLSAGHDRKLLELFAEAETPDQNDHPKKVVAG